ncbi:MAG: DMT family transporter [Alphaproteobacteria bacterium]|nr:DMT family transporter [Alphaproteobacteria bacterium]
MSGGRPASPLPAILTLMVAMTVVPVMDAIAKHLSATLPVNQITWARYVFHLALAVPMMLMLHPARELRPARLALQLLRGLMLVISTYTFFLGVAYLPLADALALAFIAPLAVTALSPLLLGEHVGARRFTAVAVGFLGALVIIRPGSGLMHWAAAYPLAAGISYALYVVLTRKLAGTAPPLVTLVYGAIIGALVTSASLPFAWKAPAPAEWGWMVAIGLCAALAHYLIIRAYEHAPASLLSPFSYIEIVSASALGYFCFGDFPDGWTWVGIAILIASGVYISLRERKLALKRDVPSAPS